MLSRPKSTPTLWLVSSLNLLLAIACSSIGWDPEEEDVCSEGCQAESCGDSIVQSDEECDDGNNEPGDGCDADCNKESTEEGSTCPNDVVEFGETCDFAGAQPCALSCDEAGEMTGTYTCSDCQKDSCAAPQEICNGKDDNCDGIVDEGCLDKVMLCSSVTTTTGNTSTGPLDLNAIDHGYALESEVAGGLPGYNCSDIVSWYVYREQIPGTIPLYRAYSGTEFALSVSLAEIDSFGYTVNQTLGYVLEAGTVDPLPSRRDAQLLDRYLRNGEPADVWSYQTIPDPASLGYAHFPFSEPIRVWSLQTPE